MAEGDDVLSWGVGYGEKSEVVHVGSGSDRVACSREDRVVGEFEEGFSCVQASENRRNWRSLGDSYVDVEKGG